MPILKIHLGVPTYNQVVVELFDIPAAAPAPAHAALALPLAGPPVLTRRVTFNIVPTAAPGVDQLEYVNTLTAADGITPITTEAYLEGNIDPAHIVAIDTAVAPHTVASGWNRVINHPDFITPEHLNTFIPQRLLLRDEEAYRREAELEAFNYNDRRNRDLPGRAVPILGVITARIGVARGIAGDRPAALRNKLYEAQENYKRTVDDVTAAARERNTDYDDAVRDKIREFPAIDHAAPTADVRREIDRLARQVASDDERIDIVVNVTNEKITILDKALNDAQTNTREINTNSRSSSSAARQFNNLRTNYTKIEENFAELERARVQINQFLVAAAAYKAQVDALRARATADADAGLAKVNNEIAIIDNHVNRLKLLANQLQRETRADLQARITALQTTIAGKETRLTNHRNRTTLLVPPTTPEILAKEIEADKTTLKHLQYKLNNLVPMDEAMPDLVESKARAELRQQEIIEQEGVARNVFNDVTRMVAELEASKMALNTLRESIKRAQKAFNDVRDSYNRAMRTENSAEANTLLTKAEQAQKIAKDEYFKIRDAETRLLQKFAELTPPVMQALRDELNLAGNVEARTTVTEAIDKLIRTKDELQNELTRLLPDNNIYLNNSLDLDAASLAIRQRAAFINLKNDYLSLTQNIGATATTPQNEYRDVRTLLGETLTQIKADTKQAKLSAEEYNRKKEYYLVEANKAASEASKSQKRAQDLLDNLILRDTTARINRIRHEFELRLAPLHAQITTLQTRLRDIDPARAPQIQEEINTAIARHAEIVAAMGREVTEINAEKDRVVAEARTILAASNDVVQAADTARATSPSKWVDKWSEHHNIPPGRYTKAVKKIFEYLLNPSEEDPSVAADRAAADARRGAPAVIMGGAPAVVPRVLAAVDNEPGLKNKDMIGIIESTHSAFKQYQLVKQGEDARNIDGLKRLGPLTRGMNEKAKVAVIESEKMLNDKVKFSKHEIPYPDRAAVIAALPPGTPPPPERIAEYIEQKFTTQDLIKKVPIEASIRHYKNSNESNVISEGAIRAQVTDVVNRLGFPPLAGKYPDNKFPIHFDPLLTAEQKELVKDTVIKAFGELGFARATVDANVRFADLPAAVAAPAPARPMIR